MKIKENIPPRTFHVGKEGKVEISDCAHIQLEPDEQITFETSSGSEYDVVRKSWGYYATPSLNIRLKKFGFKSALVKGSGGNYHIWIIEKNKDAELKQYLSDDPHQIVTWLETDADFDRLDRFFFEKEQGISCLCESTKFTMVHELNTPPEKEANFQFTDNLKRYLRQLFKCDVCGHYISVHQMDDGDLYNGEYVNAHYKSADGLQKTFKRIISLPEEKSDNKQRVNRIIKFSKNFFPNQNSYKPLSLLDIGSGLCVFPYEMQQKGWNCTAVDTDPRQVEHAQKVAGVKTACGDISDMPELGTFDVITFNKVLEHVSQPIALLKGSNKFLKKNGFVYVELPDGEAAFKESPEREEFTIDHPHIFSFASSAILASKAGFEIKLLERLKESSGKYTIIMILTATVE